MKRLYTLPIASFACHAATCAFPARTMSDIPKRLSSSLCGGFDITPLCDKFGGGRNETLTPSQQGVTSTATSSSAAAASADPQLPLGPVVLRGRVERVRGQGSKLVFLRLRQPPFSTIQVVCYGKDMAAHAKTITVESIVEVEGTVVRTKAPVSSTTCGAYEFHAAALRVLSAAESPLPFPLLDVNTKLDTRLNHRPVDLRTPLSAAAMRVVSVISQVFRTQLLADDFVEIHTPKMIAAASEGGSAVFEVNYFDSKAYLAQSPQLYKQMALMGDAMRVFEIGPVFRAEQSLTHRHLTEFVGLDAEMVVMSSYLEVLDVLERVMCGVITELQTTHATLVAVACESLRTLREAAAPGAEAGCASPTAPIVSEVPDDIMEKFGIARDGAEHAASKDSYGARVGGSSPRVLRLSFDNAARLLRDNDGDVSESIDDFSLPQERQLGHLVKARYGVDLYVVDQFHASARAFYTKPLSSEQPDRTCSYDMYLRGEEICSGAQRINDAAELKAQITSRGIDAEGMKDYVDSFRYGAWPHGGFGLGLERIASFFLGAQDIRQVSMFPRDPKRLRP